MLQVVIYGFRRMAMTAVVPILGNERAYRLCPFLFLAAVALIPSPAEVRRGGRGGRDHELHAGRNAAPRAELALHSVISGGHGAHCGEPEGVRK